MSVQRALTDKLSSFRLAEYGFLLHTFYWIANLKKVQNPCWLSPGPLVPWQTTNKCGTYVGAITMSACSMQVTQKEGMMVLQVQECISQDKWHRFLTRKFACPNPRMWRSDSISDLYINVPNFLVKSMNTFRMANRKLSRATGANSSDLSMVLMKLKANSTGFMSGEYLGKNMNFTSILLKNCRRTRSASNRWIVALSTTTTSQRYRHG